MRSPFSCTFCILAAALASRAGNLTIVLEFQDEAPNRSVHEMKREFEALFRGSGLKFDWRTRKEAEAESFDNLVVVRFRGKCILKPAPWLLDERGPMALTYSTGGAIQPFAEVQCDQVAAAARSAMSGSDFAHADVLFGRALGRVIAHELVHILARSGAHGRDGVAKRELSGAALISPDMRLSPADLDRIYTQP